MLVFHLNYIVDLLYVISFDAKKKEGLNMFRI